MNEEKEWVRLCDAADAPAEGELARAEAAGREICLANVAGTLRAMDNRCPHRDGPLHEGWIENGEIVCPWHGWSFDPVSGACTNARGPVDVFAVKVQGADVLIQIA
jgi:nitrite reductase (NADH) small subunit